MSRHTKRVLVTGGAGFIGSHLVRELVAAGHAVRVLDDFSSDARERLDGLAVEVMQGDVRQLAALRRALHGAEVVFHLAGVRAPYVGGDDDGALEYAEDVNVGGTLHLLQAAREERPRRVVIAGSGEVYGRTPSCLLHEQVTPLPATFHAVEQLAIEHHVRVCHESFQAPTVLLRIFDAFGPAQAAEGPSAGLVPRLCRAALERTSPLIVGDPRRAIDLVYVSNVVSALWAAGATPGIDGEVLNVASGEAASLAQLWSLLCELAGLPPHQLEPVYTPAPSPSDSARVSIARAARTIGYHPAVGLREGLRRTMDWYRELWHADPNAWFSPRAEPGDEARAEAVEEIDLYLDLEELAEGGLQ